MTPPLNRRNFLKSMVGGCFLIALPPMPGLGLDTEANWSFTILETEALPDPKDFSMILRWLVQLDADPTKHVYCAMRVPERQDKNYEVREEILKEMGNVITSYFKENYGGTT